MGEYQDRSVSLEMIDHGRGPDQPGIGGSGLLIASPLGAEDGRFLLRFADEQHAGIEAKSLSEPTMGL